MMDLYGLLSNLPPTPTPAAPLAMAKNQSIYEAPLTWNAKVAMRDPIITRPLTCKEHSTFPQKFVGHVSHQEGIGDPSLDG